MKTLVLFHIPDRRWMAIDGTGLPTILDDTRYFRAILEAIEHFNLKKDETNYLMSASVEYNLKTGAVFVHTFGGVLGCKLIPRKNGNGYIKSVDKANPFQKDKEFIELHNCNYDPQLAEIIVFQQLRKAGIKIINAKPISGR